MDVCWGLLLMCQWLKAIVDSQYGEASRVAPLSEKYDVIRRDTVFEAKRDDTFASCYCIEVFLGVQGGGVISNALSKKGSMGRT